jgi:hypothetical protein
MDQQRIVVYLKRKGWTTRVIHNNLVATLAEEAIAYSTVTEHFRETQNSPGDPIQLSDATSPHIDDSDQAILRALEELPSSSVRQLSGVTLLPKITAYRQFYAKHGFAPPHLR